MLLELLMIWRLAGRSRLSDVLQWTYDGSSRRCLECDMASQRKAIAVIRDMATVNSAPIVQATKDILLAVLQKELNEVVGQLELPGVSSAAKK